MAALAHLIRSVARSTQLVNWFRRLKASTKLSLERPRAESSSVTPQAEQSLSACCQPIVSLGAADHIFQQLLAQAKSTRRGSMFGKRAPPAVEHAPGSYAAVHEKFAQYHQLPGNCNAHAFTLLLGLLGTAGLIIRGCVSLSKDKPRASAVSYTHLTLPTICSV